MLVSTVSNKKYSLFIHPRSQIVKKSSKEKVELPIPQEFKWAYNTISFKDLYITKDIKPQSINITQAIEEEFKDSIQKIALGKKSRKDFLRDLVLDSFTPTESHSILAQSIYHTFRAKEWAEENKERSGKAAKCILLSIPFGILKAVLNNLDSSPIFLKQIISSMEGLLAGLRGYLQFKVYGERIDEDRAENKYEAEYYGNKASGFFADRAYEFETKINPLVLPALGFFNERIQNAIRPLLSLCNILWWRIRMPAEINQRFATDLLNFIIHKPLTFFGRKKSKKILNEIDKENLTYKYINKRARDLIGLDPKKDKSVSMLSKLFIEIKSLFTGNYNKKIKSSIKINKFISPFFGLYGFFTALFGIPLNSIHKLCGKENKYRELITQTAFASQQVIYFFRLILPEHLENIKINKDIKDKNVIELKKKRIKSFYTGASICLMNIASIFLKLFNFENKYLKLGLDIYNEISDKGISYYLSNRRKILGMKFELDNPELFNNKECEVKQLNPVIAVY